MIKTPEPGSIRQLLEQATRLLHSDSARLDAEVLLASVLDKPRSHLHAWPERVPPPAARAQYDELLQRRVAGEPVAYLTGVREFWSLSLAVTPDTLIPRPETETLVALALGLFSILTALIVSPFSCSMVFSARCSRPLRPTATAATHPACVRSSLRASCREACS